MSTINMFLGFDSLITFIQNHQESLQPACSMFRVSTREKAWGLLWHQAMPSCVTELLTDGCVHLLYKNSWKFHQFAAGQLLSGKTVQYRKGSRYGPFMTYKITPAGSLSYSQPGGPPCWASLVSIP
jgi:hypothetical protein